MNDEQFDRDTINENHEMSDTKHTPGPWLTQGSVTDVYSESGWTICEVYATTAETDQGKADRSLIAAAPDMLEALELALPHIECDSAEQSSIISLCGEAIAKAKGGAK